MPSIYAADMEKGAARTVETGVESSPRLEKGLKPLLSASRPGAAELPHAR